MPNLKNRLNKFSKTCMLLCITLVFLICICCASVAIVKLKECPRVNIDGEAHKVRIFIDQGHNPTSYHNEGAEGNGLYEQDLNFSIGCMLADILEADGRFEVCLSRPYESTVLGVDTASSLKARIDGAEDFNADYFISLHVNAYTEESVNGIEVFVPFGDTESYLFGSFLLNGMVDATALENRGMKQSTDLYVLQNTTMPAALLEMGFISNTEDATLLSEQPELFAHGIYDGITEYLESAYILYMSILIVSVAVVAALIIFVSITLKRNKKISKNK